MNIDEEKSVVEKEVIEKDNPDTEIMVTDQTTELADFQYSIVDLDNPQTILSYGEDIMKDITDILSGSSRLTNGQEVIIDDAIIDSIGSFEESLDESEEKRNKKQPLVVSKVVGFFSNLGFAPAKQSEASMTYQGCYEEWLRSIENVRQLVEQQMQASLEDINLRETIVKDMKPLVRQLELAIKIGKLEKKKYDEKTITLKETAVTPEEIYNVRIREQISALFDGKLVRLESAVIAYREQMAAYGLQQHNEMMLVMENQQFLSTNSHILEAQGSVAVFSREQAQRIEAMSNLNQATTDAIIKNAQIVEKNVSAAVDLSLNQGISVEALNEYASALNKGKELIKKGNEQKRINIAKDRDALEKLNKSLDGFKEEVSCLLEDQDLLAGLVSQDSYVRPSSSARVKARGQRKGKK